MLCIFALKYFLRILHVNNINIFQNLLVDKLMIEDTDIVKFGPFEYKLKFKTTRYG